MAEATANQPVMPGPEGQGMVAVAPRQINPIDAVAQSRAVRHISKLVGLAAAIAVASFGWVYLPIALGCVAAAYVLLNIVPIRDVYRSVEWPVIVLLGSMIPSSHILAVE